VPSDLGKSFSKNAYVVEPQRRHSSSDGFWHYVSAVIYTPNPHFQNCCVHLRKQFSVLLQKGENKLKLPQAKETHDMQLG
jgi:hypothetical protein